MRSNQFCLSAVCAGVALLFSTILAPAFAVTILCGGRMCTASLTRSETRSVARNIKAVEALLPGVKVTQNDGKRIEIAAKNAAARNQCLGIRYLQAIGSNIVGASVYGSPYCKE